MGKWQSTGRTGGSLFQTDTKLEPLPKASSLTCIEQTCSWKLWCFFLPSPGLCWGQNGKIAQQNQNSHTFGQHLIPYKASRQYSGLVLIFPYFPNGLMATDPPDVHRCEDALRIRAVLIFTLGFWLLDVSGRHIPGCFSRGPHGQRLKLQWWVVGFPPRKTGTFSLWFSILNLCIANLWDLGGWWFFRAVNFRWSKSGHFGLAKSTREPGFHMAGHHSIQIVALSKQRLLSHKRGWSSIHSWVIGLDKGKILTKNPDIWWSKSWFPMKIFPLTNPLIYISHHRL